LGDFDFNLSVDKSAVQLNLNPAGRRKVANSSLPDRTAAAENHVNRVTYPHRILVIQIYYIALTMLTPNGRRVEVLR